jgi:hypothetical protein
MHPTQTNAPPPPAAALPPLTPPTCCRSRSMHPTCRAPSLPSPPLPPLHTCQTLAAAESQWAPAAAAVATWPNAPCTSPLAQLTCCRSTQCALPAPCIPSPPPPPPNHYPTGARTRCCCRTGHPRHLDHLQSPQTPSRCCQTAQCAPAVAAHPSPIFPRDPHLPLPNAPSPLSGPAVDRGSLPGRL